jgi:hypothetical protein
MAKDFKRALARVQRDYDFYVDCQLNPGEALKDYDLSPDERATLTDPEKLADALRTGVGIRITISGTHDWVNRAARSSASMAEPDHDRKVADEVKAVREAGSDEERTEAAVRLMELIG